MDVTHVDLILFIAVFTVAGSNVLKALTKLRFKDAKVGLIYAMIIGTAISVGIGQGFLNMLMKVDYKECLYPMVIMWTDILVSGWLYSMGSKLVTDFFGKVVEMTTDFMDLYKKKDPVKADDSVGRAYISSDEVEGL